LSFPVKREQGPLFVDIKVAPSYPLKKKNVTNGKLRWIIGTELPGNGNQVFQRQAFSTKNTRSYKAYSSGYQPGSGATNKANTSGTY
jgi:hypothetical protein